MASNVIPFPKLRVKRVPLAANDNDMPPPAVETRRAA
jgi:hypothetical protein